MDEIPDGHAHRGLAFEALLQSIHDRYAFEGVARVLRTPPVFHIVRREKSKKTGKPGLLVGYMDEGPQDYEAMVPWGVLALEAKSRQDGRLEFADLPPHQAEHLDAVEAMRRRYGTPAWGLVLVHLQVVPAAWVVSWSAMGPRWWTWKRNRDRGIRAELGTASFGVTELDEIGIRWDVRVGWLEAARQACCPV